MRGCSRWNSAGGLPETSNCYCLPGIAGGSPAHASDRRARLRRWGVSLREIYLDENTIQIILLRVAPSVAPHFIGIRRIVVSGHNLPAAKHIVNIFGCKLIVIDNRTVRVRR